MKVNNIEEDFLKEVREAAPEDCKTVVAALYDLDGREDETGELTPLGFLVGAMIEELILNGVMNRNGEGQADV